MNLADTYILFELDSALYGVRSRHVQHVELLEHITPVPNTAPAVDGVVFSRGQVVPAINLRARFGLPRQPHTPQSRLIVLKVQGRTVALVVDAAREFQKIPDSAIGDVQETLVGIGGDFVKGVASVRDRSVLILDVGAVLTLEETTLPPEIPASPSAVAASES